MIKSIHALRAYVILGLLLSLFCIAPYASAQNTSTEQEEQALSEEILNKFKKTMGEIFTKNKVLNYRFSMQNLTGYSKGEVWMGREYWYIKHQYTSEDGTERNDQYLITEGILLNNYDGTWRVLRLYESTDPGVNSDIQMMLNFYRYEQLTNAKTLIKNSSRLVLSSPYADWEKEHIQQLKLHASHNRQQHLKEPKKRKYYDDLLKALKSNGARIIIDRKTGFVLTYTTWDYQITYSNMKLINIDQAPDILRVPPKKYESTPNFSKYGPTFLLAYGHGNYLSSYELWAVNLDANNPTYKRVPLKGIPTPYAVFTPDYQFVYAATRERGSNGTQLYRLDLGNVMKQSRINMDQQDRIYKPLHAAFNGKLVVSVTTPKEAKQKKPEVLYTYLHSKKEWKKIGLVNDVQTALWLPNEKKYLVCQRKLTDSQLWICMINPEDGKTEWLHQGSDLAMVSVNSYIYQHKTKYYQVIFGKPVQELDINIFKNTYNMITPHARRFFFALDRRKKNNIKILDREDGGARQQGMPHNIIRIMY